MILCPDVTHVRAGAIEDGVIVEIKLDPEIQTAGGCFWAMSALFARLQLSSANCCPPWAFFFFWLPSFASHDLFFSEKLMQMSH